MHLKSPQSERPYSTFYRWYLLWQREKMLPPENNWISWLAWWTGKSVWWPCLPFPETGRTTETGKKEKAGSHQLHLFDSDRLCIGDDFRKNFGYAALSKIYHELEIHTFLINRQWHSKEQYDTNTIMKMLVYSRLLSPASKKSSFDGRVQFFWKDKLLSGWCLSMSFST